MAWPRQRQDSFIDDLNTTSEVKKVQLHTLISIYFYLLIISTTILFFIINCTIFRICNPSCTYIKLKVGDNTSNLRLFPPKFLQKNPNRTKEIIHERLAISRYFVKKKPLASFLIQQQLLIHILLYTNFTCGGCSSPPNMISINIVSNFFFSFGSGKI